MNFFNIYVSIAILFITKESILTNIEFLESNLRNKQKRVIETKKISQAVVKKTVADYQLKMSLKQDVANLLVAKYFLYKEEKSHIIQRREHNCLFVSHEIVRKDPSELSYMSQLMAHEINYYDFRKEDFAKQMLRENLVIIQEYLVNSAQARGLSDMFKPFENFKNSEDQKQKTQVIANFFAERKIRERADVIDILSKTISKTMRHDFFEANHLDSVADELAEHLPFDFQQSLLNKDERVLFIYFKNYYSLYSFLINIL